MHSDGIDRNANTVTGKSIDQPRIYNAKLGISVPFFFPAEPCVVLIWLTGKR